MNERDSSNKYEDWLSAEFEKKYLAWLALPDDKKAEIIAELERASNYIAEGRLRLLALSPTYGHLCELTWGPATERAIIHDRSSDPAHSVDEGDLSQQSAFNGSDPTSQADSMFAVVMDAPRIGELPKETVINPANSFQNRWQRACAARDIFQMIRHDLTVNPDQNLASLDLHGASFVVPLDLTFTDALAHDRSEEGVIRGFVDHLITAQRKFVIHPIADDNPTATLLSEGNRFCAETRSPLFVPPERILIYVGPEEVINPNATAGIRLRAVGLLLSKDLPSDKPEVRRVNKIPWEVFK